MSDPHRPGPAARATGPVTGPATGPATGPVTGPATGPVTSTTVRSDAPPSSATSGSLAPSDSPRRPVQVSVARRGPRRARLVIKHVDPWTVMKVTFVVSIVLLVVVVIAVAIIYAVLGRMGVWDSINDLVNSVAPTTASATWHNPLTGSRIIGITAVLGAINVVLMTALFTLGAAIYNLISDLVGGVEVTLSDP